MRRRISAATSVTTNWPVQSSLLSTIGSLHGLAASELEPHELEHNDPNYELLVMVRAQK